MLDNFGMGEFLMLALFALLFFGPERLPQIGARVGRWLNQLTQASKVFMNQWTEEAAVIQDAVREVQGIRDEIRAAQAEISGSLDVARQDIAETIDEARGTVRDATVTPQDMLQAGAEQNAAAQAGPLPAIDTSAPPRLATQEETETAPRRASPSSGSESEALSKTQNVLDDLLAKRGLSLDEAEESGHEPGDLPGDNGAEPVANEEAERAEEVKVPLATESDSEPDAQAGSSSVEGGQEATQADQDAQDRVQESAFDKTQRILDGLLGAPTEKESATEKEPAAKAEPPGKAKGAVEAASEAKVEPTTEAELPIVRAESPAEDNALPEEAPVPADREPAGAQPKVVGPSSDGAKAAPSDGVQRVTGLQQGVSFGEFTKLSIQVTQLRQELQAIQRELQTLRASPQSSATVEDGSEGASMEEVA
jgi:Sec-independent protein translocase protein TatA